MSYFEVGDLVYTTVLHTDICGEPETNIHGKVIGYNNGKYQLEVPHYGIFEVPFDKLKGEKE